MRQIDAEGEVGMTKTEVKDALDRIKDYSDEEIAINWIFIKQVAEAAYGLIKSLERAVKWDG